MLFKPYLRLMTDTRTESEASSFPLVNSLPRAKLASWKGKQPSGLEICGCAASRREAPLWEAAPASQA